MISINDKLLIEQIAKAFGMDAPEKAVPLGGTATQKYAVTLPQGKFVIRARPTEFSDAEQTQFDHEVLRRLAKAGLPVPSPQQRQDGTSWYEFQGCVYEILSWVEGTPFEHGNQQQVIAAGQFLGMFHQILHNNIPPGKEGFVREDHPDLLRPYLNHILTLTENDQQIAQLRQVGQQLDRVKQSLDSKLYDTLPAAVIHGDFHPGNVYFSNSHVAAVYDFDYVSRQAKIRDVCDGLMFFASRRENPFNPDDIHSLTQPFQPELSLAANLLKGYQENGNLSLAEWHALPWLIRSRWLQIRLRGSRKVTDEEKIEFVLNKFFDVTDWLDRQANGFFESLKNQSASSAIEG